MTTRRGGICIIPVSVWSVGCTYAVEVRTDEPPFFPRQAIGSSESDSGAVIQMRKTKDIKRKRKTAGIEYRKGNREAAYKMWREAKKEMDTLRGRNEPAAEKPAESSADKPGEATAEKPAE